MRRTVCHTWRGLVQHLSLLQADGEAEVLGCIREAVKTMCCSFLRVDEKGAVVRKQQLSDECVDGFLACEKTPKVEETAVCSETDVDAIRSSNLGSPQIQPRGRHGIESRTR